MTKGNVFVKETQALINLNSELVKYSQNLANDMSSIQKEIGRAVEWIREKERHWRNRVAECRKNLNSAKRDYANCVSLNSQSETNWDCSSEAANVAKCERELSEAETQLQLVYKWRGVIDSKVSEFMVHFTRTRDINNSTISQSSTFLQSKVRQLDRYQSISLELPTSLPKIGKHGPSYQRAKQEMLLRALDDPTVGRDVKGWIRNQRRRVLRGDANYMRMPPGYDAGHRIPGVETAANLRLEDIWINRSRYHRAIRLGLEERYR